MPVNLERFNAEQLRLSEIETGIVIKAQGIEFDRSKRNKSGNGIYDTNVKISDSMRAVLSRAQYRP
ncbi:hypothetical protein [Diaphorobacter aerolatus]|uniref:Uncharacterized protein n=1 Tax=Diaphorobacter aerolatus TaxID=1288495 RepID=A0A7H0GL31_9BURK|nr:hypothetical protein [Diaphorobacter aerolatus]QNP48997.1 hypothetical protein H9K75_02145 [Diaphorobacter aerolatus]